jgi:periplasmic divalent cation tolerance protein
MSQTGVVTIYATFGDAAAADAAATTLVTERLAACGTILPGATSVYRWQGKLERASEAVLLLKTTAGAADQAIARLKALHAYELPAIAVWPVDTGFAPYLRWVKDQTI